MQKTGKTLLVASLLTISVLLLVTPSTAVTDTSSGVQLERMSIHADIDGAYAITQVAVTLHNPTKEAKDRDFTFQVPVGALISQFSIEVGGAVYEADIIEAQEAKDRYNQAVSEGRTAGLLASRDANRFTYGLSVRAGQTVTARLTFEQMLLKTNGLYTYHLYLTSDPLPIPAGAFDVMVEIEASSAIDILEIGTYDGVADVLREDTDSAKVSLVRQDFVPEDDLVVKWGTVPSPVEGMMYFYEADGEGYFAHVLSPSAQDLGGVMAKDFVFILDRSGSMRGSKFEQAKEVMMWLLDTLNERDRFNIVCFDTQIRRYEDSLVKASSEEVKDGKDWVSDLQTGGGTNIHIGVMQALKLFKEGDSKVPIIVLISDGKANTGLYHRSEFRKDVRQKNVMEATIHTAAIGGGADWPFLKALALENDGKAIWLEQDDKISERLKDFIKSVKDPLMSDLRVDYGDAVMDVYPESLRGYYLGSEVLITGRYIPGTTVMTSTIVTYTKEGSRDISHDFIVGPSPDNGFVSRLYANARIQDLQDKIVYDGEKNETVQEIIDLGIRYHFVTSYTSFFIDLPEEALPPEMTDPQVMYPSYDSGAYSTSSAACEDVPGMGSDLAALGLLTAAILMILVANRARGGRKGR